MHRALRRSTFSPAVRSEMAELGLPPRRPALAPALLLSIAVIDVTSVVLSLVAY